MDAPEKSPAPEKLEHRIAKREMISSDKDGTLEKVYFEKEARTVKGDNGKEYTKLVTPWELRATGRKLQELKGSFKESAPQMMHEGMKAWADGGGDLKITKPDGSVDTIRADKEHLYRSQPGFCQRRVRPGITVDGFGGMRRDGLSRMRIRYSNGERIIEEAS